MRFFGGKNFSFKPFKLFYSSYFLIRSESFCFVLFFVFLTLLLDLPLSDLPERTKIFGILDIHK